MTDSSSGADPVIPPDPIYQKSYSLPIALASIALVGAVAFAIADEAWLRRPYKPIQREYKAATLVYLDKLEGRRSDFQQALRSLDDFKALDEQVAQAMQATAAESDKLKGEFADLSAEVDALKEAIKIPRSEISALTYDAGHAAHTAFEDGDAETPDPDLSPAAKPYLERIHEIEAEPLPYHYTRGSDGEVVNVTGTTAEAIRKFVDLQEAKGKKQAEVGVALAPVSEAQKARDAWLKENLASIEQYCTAPRPVRDEWGDYATDDDGNPTGETYDPEGLRAELVAKVTEVGAVRYLDDYTTAAGPEVVAKVRAKLAALPTDPILGGEIQQFQIHIKESNNWVDRCEVCHLGTRSVLPITEEALADAVREDGWSEERIEAANLKLFASHPKAAELFKDHDPEKVGCSICHNGNGIAITSVETAHGENHHWDWPLHQEENIEAGCLQCHQMDVFLESGPRISAARKTFKEKGCWGCHPYQGFDAEQQEITQVSGRIDELTRDQDDMRRRQQSLRAVVQQIDDDAVLNRVGAESSSARDALTEKIAQTQTEVDQLARRLAALHEERSRVGPNLKDVKAKWRPEVLTSWVQDPTSVRLDTKMPVFRYFGAKDESGLYEEAKDVAAFIWQSALDPADYPEYKLTAPAGGSPGTGKALFEKVGCLGCHAIEKDGVKVGGHFAANLSNLGDKAKYEYVYRWIKDPRHRLVPWSVTKKKDLTSAEAAKEDPQTLVWRQPTRMPSLRLSDDEARDIATYLTSLKSDRKWPTATWLDDPDRFEKGKTLVVFFGCAGCHEIRGLESERGIGTELTKEGSKPLDRLDFGHHTTAAKRGEEILPDWTSADGVKVFEPEVGKHWYRPRGYFMHKLAKPDVYDVAKYFEDRTLRSRMPQFRLTAVELQDLTTFLMGSVESKIPQSVMYNPDDDGQAVRDGWWVVQRYNCEGCHTVVPGQVPDFQKLPWWAPDEKKDRVFPPTLVGEGFRVRPDWMPHFLNDPSLGGGTARPRSLRRHLDVRMPTYSFTEDEVSKLVQFFEGEAGQPAVYQVPQVPKLTAAERKGAEAIWAPTGMNCLQCHLTNDKETPDAETKAPHLGYAKSRLKPEWMYRWIPNPPAMQPWTSMTVNFKREREGDERSRWVYFAPLPGLDAVKIDHVDLMIRWITHDIADPK